MPPAVAAAGITAGAGLIGSAMDKYSQGNARKASAREFAFFSDPLLRFGGRSGALGKKYLSEYDRLTSDYENALRGELSGLDEASFQQFREADLRQSLEGAAPQVNRILGAVAGSGFNPTRSGRGASGIGGLYENILGAHADRITKERLNRAGMRAALAQGLGGIGQFGAELGTGFRSEQGGILEAMLQAPAGTSKYMENQFAYGGNAATSRLQRYNRSPGIYSRSI